MITKDTQSEKWKAMDMPFLTDINPSKSHKQPQEQRKKTNNNYNPIAKKIPELEIKDPSVAV